MGIGETGPKDSREIQNQRDEKRKNATKDKILGIGMAGTVLAAGAYMESDTIREAVSPVTQPTTEQAGKTIEGLKANQVGSEHANEQGTYDTSKELIEKQMKDISAQMASPNATEEQRRELQAEYDIRLQQHQSLEGSHAQFDSEVGPSLEKDQEGNITGASTTDGTPYRVDLPPEV